MVTQPAGSRPRLRFDAAHVLDVIDSHTCGQPTRVILRGTGLSPGTDPTVARELLANEHDWIRRFAVFEPRGHRSMFAVALIAPAPGDEDYGVLFMDAGGYPDMCGHATIGVATTLFELGLIEPAAPDHTGFHHFGLRTPAGRLALRATLREGRCEAIAFRSPIAFYLGAVDLVAPDGGAMRVDIAYGGQWYAFVPVEAVGLRIVPDAIDDLIAAAAPVRAQLAKALTIADPRSGRVPEVGNIVWTSPGTSDASATNVPISSSNAFDRSPCGTATCARMATLVAQGALGIGAPFINEGIMGTRYVGVAVADKSLGTIKGIIPEVEGRAWITSRAELRIDARDPLARGYLIGNGKAQ
jgi:proline racemase